MEQDEAKAVIYFTKSSLHGLAGASNNLGKLYNNGGITIIKDENKARQYYKDAALKGLFQSEISGKYVDIY